MKRITAIALFVLASLIAVRGAEAQQRGVQATVPFDFSVDGTLLPAGTYKFTTENFLTVLIRNDQHHANVMSIAPAYVEASKDGKLIFKRYGNQYFLNEIVSSASGLSVELPTSKAEKRARLQEASLHNGNQTDGDRVLVALNR